MTDEPQAPDEAQGSLDQTDGPQEGTPVEQQEQSHDWEQRFKDTQAAYTQSQQELRQFQEAWGQLQDPQSQADALRQFFGLELTEEEAKELQQELEGEDQQFRDPRVDQLIEQQQEMMLQQQATQLQAELETGINQHAAGKEVDLSERQLNSIFRDALDLAAQRNISPAQAADEAFREWFEEYESLSNRAIEQYRGSKKPRNQPPPKPGQSGVPEIPRGDNKAKLALANAIAEEAAQSS